MSSLDGHRHVLTDRLDLRAVAEADVGALHRLTSDPVHSDHVPGGLQETREGPRAGIERFRGRWDITGLSYWTVRLRATGEVIGIGGAECRPGFWNLFYLLDSGFWGSGYATDLARAARRAAESVAPDLALVALIHADTAASQGVARRLALTDYVLLGAAHWNGEPMHYWADREPGARLGPR